MLKLENVSKYYYSKGVVTSGFSRVNLELKKGEFVAITGESGSGKSTLLNVISGLDTYEDGEMLIFGEETSGYTELDFENYRKRYIANIFQNFNLVNSYTVYQNVELALMLNGRKRREYRKKILEVLKQVGLYKFRHARASRLSGGQKQRVAIARALVRDTPVIVADEPTGNLDTKSAENVWQLLSEVAKDRLVVVVTHNYDQVEPYVTRKITMHDGQIVEDLVIRQPEEQTEAKSTGKLGKLRPLQELKLGIRNTFNIIPKFVLLLFIFFFISAAVCVYYANTRAENFQQDTSGYNYYFPDTDINRIVIQKKDRSAITDEDFETIGSLDGVDRITRQDIMVDTSNHIWSGESGLSVSVVPIDSFSGELTLGELPSEPDQCVLEAPKVTYIAREENLPNILTSTWSLETNASSGIPLEVRISGVSVQDSSDWRGKLYVSNETFKQLSTLYSAAYSTFKVRVADMTFSSSPYEPLNMVVPVSFVAKGTAMVSDEWNYYFRNYRARGKYFNIDVENLYFSDSLELRIADVYTYKNYRSKTGMDDWLRGAIFVNSEDYYSLFEKGTFQSSVYLSDYEYKDAVLNALDELGYKTLHVNSATKNYGGAWEKVEKLLTTAVGASLIISLLAISYFIIRLIMRSRNTYYSTVRILGGTAYECRSLIVIELFTVLNIAYACLLAALWAAKEGYYRHELTDAVLKYLSVNDYIILYAVLAVICLWIALRYSRQLFKDSAMNTLKAV